MTVGSDSSQFVESQLTLNEGDYFFVSTDGVTELESQASGRSINGRKILDLLKLQTNESWQESLLSDLSDFHENDHFDDDLTMLRIHRRPSHHKMKKVS